VRIWLWGSGSRWVVESSWKGLKGIMTKRDFVSASFAVSYEQDRKGDEGSDWSIGKQCR